MPRPIRLQQGFSLVELSVVLAIIGLIAGGIMVGQSMIRNAEIKSVLSDFGKYRGATEQFKMQYQGLPGDLVDATQYWGTAAAGVTCLTTASTGTETCDGDGDGYVNPISTSNEYFRYWQHLGNAGLIDGTFDGIAHGSSQTGTTAENAPVGKITATLWWAGNLGTQSSDPNIFDGYYGNSFQYGLRMANYGPGNPALKPQEAWQIDSKIDDGKPAQGKVVARAYVGFNLCTTGANAAATTSDYLQSSTSITCSLIFRTLFM